MNGRLFVKIDRKHRLKNERTCERMHNVALLLRNIQGTSVGHVHHFFLPGSLLLHHKILP